MGGRKKKPLCPDDLEDFIVPDLHDKDVEKQEAFKELPDDAGWDTDSDRCEAVIENRSPCDQKTRDALLNSYKKFRQHKGFDDDSASDEPYHLAIPVDLESDRRIQFCARFAVASYNKRFGVKGKKLKFLRIVKANFYQGIRDAYFITLVVFDLSLCVEKTYQAKLQYDRGVNNKWNRIRVHIFRPQPINSCEPSSLLCAEKVNCVS